MLDARDTPGQRSRRASGALACALIAAILYFAGPGPRLDGLVGDALFAAVRAADPPTPIAGDVVVVGLDDADLAAFPEPLGLMHVHLADFIDAAGQGGASVVGIDLALPDRAYDSLAPGLDRALLAAMARARGRTPVVFARTLQADGTLRPVERRLLALAGRDGTGAALFPRDADGSVRRFDEALGAEGAPVATFVGQLARALGVTVRAGAIDFAHGPRWRTLPLRDVLAWHARGDVAALRGAFAGRPVLLGAVLPYEDRVALPVALLDPPAPAASQPGVLAHAQALRALRSGRMLAIAPAGALAVMIVLGALGWFLPWRPRITLAVAALATLAMLAATLAAWRAGTWLAPGAGLMALWTSVFLRLATDAAVSLRERRRLRAVLAPSVSPAVLREVLDGTLAARLGGERVELCVLFSDIRGFTTRSESLSPEATVALLNRYFARMVAAIHAHDGTVTSFIGDGIMAIFGAPRAVPDPCARAFAAARAMNDALADFNRELAAEGLAPVEAGIGLDAGPAIVGRIGTAERSDYTAIGDVANVASRVEGLTKGLGFRVVCTAAVAAALPREAGLVALGVQAIKGHTPVDVFGWDRLETAAQPGASQHAVA